MTQRDQSLIDLRPDIPSIDLSKSMSQQEEFQSSTLRPILKYQNVAIQKLFKQFRLSSFDTLSKADQRNRIKNLLQKNIQLGNQLLGLVIAMMTEEELEIYFKQESELKRRIKSMLVERLIQE